MNYYACNPSLGSFHRKASAFILAFSAILIWNVLLRETRVQRSLAGRERRRLIEHYAPISKKFEFSADLKSKIKTYYEESNRRLEEDLALVNNSRFRENYL